MKDFYKGKRVLVTGHTGFKGSWLVQVLLNFGAEVVGVSLAPETTPNMFDVLGIQSKIKNYFTDIRDFEVLHKIFKEEKPEIVFHLAAQAIVRTSYDDPIKTISTNVVGTAHVLEAVRSTESVKSAVIITTDKVYENKEWHYAYRENDPLGGYDPYSASKAAADIIANSYIQSFFNPKDFKVKHQTLVAIARAGNVIGGGDWAEYRLIPDIVRSIYEKKEKIQSRNPHAVRPWQHVLEPLSGYLLLGEKLYQGEVELSGAWNFGPTNESFVTVGELIDEAIKILGEGEHEHIPDSSKHEAHNLKLDINKAHSILKWKPRLAFNDTLQMTYGWYKNYYNNVEDVVTFTNEQILLFFK
ncbi:MAG: CDP-glucose 4,6-dehydratase [Bacteroidota bacterium]|nr:CDP-glucose 4,6-dehydratase [Bacteroidota bacterium]